MYIRYITVCLDIMKLCLFSLVGSPGMVRTDSINFGFNLLLQPHHFFKLLVSWDQMCAAALGTW